MAKWYDWILNPVGALIGSALKKIPGTNSDLIDHSTSSVPFSKDWLSSAKRSFNSIIGDPLKKAGSWISDNWSDIKDSATGVWNDLTGKSQIEMQNQLDREMAEEEYQRNLQSIGDTAAAYEAAGFNRNLMYSKDGVSYSAPQLQAYSGSAKLDNILNRTGKLIGMIPAFYQATAALEGIDQARERTKQSEIKTMSMGMSLLDQGYRLGDSALSHPFNMDLNGLEGGKRHWLHKTDPVQIALFRPYGSGYYDNNGRYIGDGGFAKYADLKMKNQFDLLRSIGIKNDMNSTLNDWRGYQYELDRRFGAAGRIVGMASQGVGSIGKLLTPGMRKFGFK